MDPFAFSVICAVLVAGGIIFGIAFNFWTNVLLLAAIALGFFLSPMLQEIPAWLIANAQPHIIEWIKALRPGAQEVVRVAVASVVVIFCQALGWLLRAVFENL